MKTTQNFKTVTFTCTNHGYHVAVSCANGYWLNGLRIKGCVGDFLMQLDVESGNEQDLTKLLNYVY